MQHVRSERIWRIALDTASFISGVRSRRGAARELLRLVFDRRLTIVMDCKLRLEYQDVALRAHHLVASKMSLEEMSELIETIADYAEPV
jgi:predicted nucleic acid-binding protein